MSIQLNQQATGCCLTEATERMNGHMMRNFYLFLEIVSTGDISIDRNNKANMVVKDKNGKISFMDDSNEIGKNYELHTDCPAFLKIEFALFEKEWQALLQGGTVLLTFLDTMFDISTVINDLLNAEESK